MRTRRAVITVLGTAALAGCSTNAAQQSSEKDEEAAAAGAGSGSPNPDPIQNPGILHDNWINADKQAYVPALEQGTQAYVQARKTQGLHHGLYQAIDTANQQLGGSSTLLKTHKNIGRVVDEILSSSHQLYSVYEEGKSAKLNTSQLPIGRYWLQQDTQDDSGDVKDVLALLTPEHKATHLKGTQPDNPTLGEQVLLSYRNAENFGTHGPHDIEAIQNAIEYYKSTTDREYDEERLEEIHGYWLERQDTGFWTEGVGLPVEGNWGEYNDEFHSVRPEVNKQMANADEIGEGDVAAFILEDSDVTLYLTDPDYDPKQDGMPTEEELAKQI